MKNLVLAILMTTAAAPVELKPPEGTFPIVAVSARSEAETGRPFRVAVTLGTGAPVGATLERGAIELRHTDARAQPLRPTLHLVDGVWYEAWVEFDEPGEWLLVLWPDVAVADRSEVGGMTAGRTIVVTRGPPGWLGSALLVAIGVGLVAFTVLTRRPRSRPRTAPAHPGDSWWWGP